MNKSDCSSKQIVWNRLFHFIPALIWMGVIFYGSSKTGDDVGKILPLVQSIFPFIKDFNFMHVVTYFILAMTFDYGFGAQSQKFKYKCYIVFLCTLYGVTDEFHQMYVGGRTPDLLDIRNDGIGALLWVLLISIPFLRKAWNKLTRK